VIDKEIIQRFPESYLALLTSEDQFPVKTVNKNGNDHYFVPGVHDDVFPEILYWMKSNNSSMIKKNMPLRTIDAHSRYLLLPELLEAVVDCPAGYVFVPGNPSYPTPRSGDGFCVMKYAASQENGMTQSTKWGVPWTKMTRRDAAVACEENGPLYHLMTNSEWMTIAENIKNNRANWSSGKVGEGFLPRGNSDNKDRSFSSAAEDNNPYYNTGFKDDWIHKRTHILSNESIIWDMAGNVWQWVSDPLTTGNHKWQEYSGQYFNLGSDNQLRLLLAPIGQYNSLQNIGKVYMADGGTIVRGGSVYNANYSGIFAAALDATEDQQSEVIGFRCVYSVLEKVLAPKKESCIIQ
jgi:hypothetical protein